MVPVAPAAIVSTVGKLSKVVSFGLWLQQTPELQKAVKPPKTSWRTLPKMGIV